MKPLLMLSTTFAMIIFSSYTIATQAYDDATNYIVLSDDEMNATTGKMGPIITGLAGAAGGAGISIAADIKADRPINWTEAGINAGAGFVTGATGAVVGPVAGAALGVSAYGALSALQSSSSNNCSGACH
ncbi:hypothetical protein V4E72_005093 [Escherichia coli]|nr:hypothetical protein [Escherichia coli]EKR6886480.1 hypothetical protein [Escherichia coli]MBC0030329.1 hypothetical protein [Escherichia coli]